MSDNIVVTVQEMDDVTVVATSVDDVTTVTEFYNPTIATRLVELADVDPSVIDNGAVLVYNASTSKWISTTTLSAQNMEGGEY